MNLSKVSIEYSDHAIHRFRWVVYAVLLCSPYLLMSQFSNVTIDAALDHSHLSPSTLGGGVLFFDADNDGWEDMIMTGGTADDAFYVNNGDGTFTDLSNNLAHNRNKQVFTSSCAAADFNRDGLTDLFFGTLDVDEPNILLINIGDNTFLNVTRQSGLDEVAQTMGGVLLDYNHDGLLDIYVLNYVLEDRYNRNENNDIIGYDHSCFQNFLYRNEGDMLFTEVSEELGLEGLGCSLAASTIPVGDNPFGLYVVHDFGEWVKPNELLVYDSIAMRFDDIAPELGLDIGLYGMGLGIGDYDNDLDLDLYVTNIGKNYLMQNQRGTYRDIAVALEVDNTTDADNGLFTTGWSNFFWDYNNDELLDLYVVNGHIPVADFLENSRRDDNKMYQNFGSGFIDISESTQLNYDHVNRGASLGDYNNDGKQDIVIATTRPGGDAILPELNFQLFENTIADRSFIQVDLEGVRSNVEGYGALLYVHTGTKTQMRYQFSGGVHASQNSTIMHVGLSDRAAIDSISIVWPSGIRDSYSNPPINQRLLITEGDQNYEILGCTDPENKSYNAMATINSGCAGTSTSVYDISSEIGFNLFPNPTQDYLNISWSDDFEGFSKIEILNSLGQVQFSQHDPDNNMLVSLEAFSSGYYYVRGTTMDELYAIDTFAKL